MQKQRLELDQQQYRQVPQQFSLILFREALMHRAGLIGLNYQAEENCQWVAHDNYCSGIGIA